MHLLGIARGPTLPEKSDRSNWTDAQTDLYLICANMQTCTLRWIPAVKMVISSVFYAAYTMWSRVLSNIEF